MESDGLILSHPVGFGRKTLADRLPGALTRDVVLVVSFAALVGLCAQIVIPLPFTPVPITGQTFAVLLGAEVLGWRRGAVGMALYAIAGVAGMPWFASHMGGTAMLANPAFGYILAYIPAAAIGGWLAERGMDRTFGRSALVMVVSNLAIYAVGVPWLALSLGVGATKALSLGFLPFIPGDALKLLVAAAMVPATYRLVDRTQS